MRMLIPIGLLLIVLGAGGSIAACYSNSATEEAVRQSAGAAVEGNTDTLVSEADGGSRPYLAPLSGLALAIGLVCVGIGMGNWRRPIPSDVRPANPWNDQPAENPNERPRGLV